MLRKGLYQEELKTLACVTMLIDHVGAALVYDWYYRQSMLAGGHIVWMWELYITMRILGRIAFPIYCFLLVEGAHHTRNPRGYALRLAVGVLLSELPFDLALNEGLDWTSNSVMITLLLGFCMLMTMKRAEGFWRIAAIVPWFLLAERLHTDYAGNGILIIAFLELTRGMTWEKPVRALGMCGLLWFGGKITLGQVTFPLELFGLVSLIPIFCYFGEKRSHSKVLQWIFYLFYPVHLTLLWIMHRLLFQ